MMIMGPLVSFLFAVGVGTQETYWLVGLTADGKRSKRKPPVSSGCALRLVVYGPARFPLEGLDIGTLGKCGKRRTGW